MPYLMDLQYKRVRACEIYHSRRKTRHRSSRSVDDSILCSSQDECEALLTRRFTRTIRGPGHGCVKPTLRIGLRTGWGRRIWDGEKLSSNQVQPAWHWQSVWLLLSFSPFPVLNPAAGAPHPVRSWISNAARGVFRQQKSSDLARRHAAAGSRRCC